jgi:branched-chain amino acid transport system ATP-binding protein
MILTIEHISYRINGCLILDDINATGDAGEVIGLIGPNGAGKSTLANVLNGFILPSDGAVRFEGRNLIGVAPQLIARQGVARTFQGQHLPWNSTPRRCLLFALVSDSGSRTSHGVDHAVSAGLDQQQFRRF